MLLMMAFAHAGCPLLPGLAFLVKFSKKAQKLLLPVRKSVLKSAVELA